MFAVSGAGVRGFQGAQAPCRAPSICRDLPFYTAVRDVRDVRGFPAIPGHPEESVSAETVEAKAQRYLGEGRLVVTRVLGDYVNAICQGDSGAYDLGHAPGRGWFCSCPVRSDRCSHLAALWLITIRRQSGPGPRDDTDKEKRR
jgi:hypothetical protein